MKRNDGPLRVDRDEAGRDGDRTPHVLWKGTSVVSYLTNEQADDIEAQLAGGGTELADAEAVARRLHETHERLALELGYETRKVSYAPWVNVPKADRDLMVAAVSEVLGITTATVTVELPADVVRRCAESGVDSLVGPEIAAACRAALAEDGQ